LTSLQSASTKSKPRSGYSFLHLDFLLFILLWSFLPAFQDTIIRTRAEKNSKNRNQMGQPSFAASNAIIYVTYGFFLCVKLKLAATLEKKKEEKGKERQSSQIVCVV
jgi:hypothetical protein